MAKSVVKETKKKAVEFFAVGRITSCFGIKGYLKVIPLTHSPERFNELEVVHIGLTDGATTVQILEDVRFQSKGICIKFKGIDDRTISEQFIGHFLFVTKDELVAPPKGSWFIHDIIGCDVFQGDGTSLGKVKDVWKMASSDLWEIQYGEKQVMFPATKEFIESVDIKKHHIVINPPEGLFEL